MMVRALNTLQQLAREASRAALKSPTRTLTVAVVGNKADAQSLFT